MSYACRRCARRGGNPGALCMLRTVRRTVSPVRSGVTPRRRALELRDKTRARVRARSGSDASDCARAREQRSLTSPAISLAVRIFPCVRVQFASPQGGTRRAIARGGAGRLQAGAPMAAPRISHVYTCQLRARALYRHKRRQHRRKQAPPRVQDMCVPGGQTRGKQPVRRGTARARASGCNRVATWVPPRSIATSSSAQCSLRDAALTHPSQCPAVEGRRRD